MNHQYKRHLWMVIFVTLTIPVSTWAAEDVDKLKADVEELKKQVKEANEWKQADSQVHLAGYGSVTYTDTEETGVNASFNGVKFNPIFHYQYRDLVMLESELELDVASSGETETKLEYLAVDLFLHDYVALIAGKMLSPLGRFRQNLHPDWINKLPSAPPGFGHDQAAPVADVGLELRGGWPMGAARANYAIHIGNGPELEADAGEIEAIETEGFTSDKDGKKVIGGRVGFLPIPKLEIGLSAATGEVAVTRDGGAPLAGDPVRDYDVAGMDFSYVIGDLRLLAEYIQQKVGAAIASVAPEAVKWEAWYAEAAYQLPQSKWEFVLRYADYDTPHASQDRKQTAVGINYLFAPHAVVKLAFESNDGEANQPSDADRALVQIAYGF